MKTAQITARIPKELKSILDEFCKSRGMIVNYFIQEAIMEKLEEYEDIEDIKKLRHESTRPLSEVLSKLNTL